MALAAGDLVEVPLRGRSRFGIVIGEARGAIPCGLKDVTRRVCCGFLPPTLLEFYRWVAEYYQGYLGEVLHLACPARVLETPGEARAPATLLAMGPEPALNVEQDQAYRALRERMDRNECGTVLLHGVTGSGKTEIYLRVVGDVIAHGGRALVMVPEISMTPQISRRFEERFGGAVVTIHSAMTEAQRRRIWHAIRAGSYSVVIGPRSAVFLPIPGLRVIVVDEEHDRSYKEHQRSIHYHGRDAAVMRGKIERALVILGSATPEVESYHNAEVGKYGLLTLSMRIDQRPMPEVSLVDLRRERRKLISPALEQALKETLGRGEQAILFLNRRGFAPSLICPNCGYRALCPLCRLPMVYHRGVDDGRGAFLACHVCDRRAAPPSRCPKCGRGTLLYRGAGTQRVESLLQRILEPAGQAQVLRLDGDVARRRGRAKQILEEFGTGMSGVLLGTQLVTKGHDFPEVTLVGVINADTVLNLPDFRSAERTFQVLTQVAGRAGRGARPGRVIIQTFHPDQYAMLVGRFPQYRDFYQAEIVQRRELGFPPFARMILLRFSGQDRSAVWREARRVRELLAGRVPGDIFGPNPAYYYRVRRDYRVYIVLKLKRTLSRRAGAFLREPCCAGVRLEIDVDPREVF